MSRMYAMVVVVEADDGEEAFRRVNEEVSPEPANAHFVGAAVEIKRSDDYTSESVGRQVAGEPDGVYTAAVAYREDGLHLFGHEGDRNAFATAAESAGEIVQRGWAPVNDEADTKKLIAAEVASER